MSATAFSETSVQPRASRVSRPAVVTRTGAIVLARHGEPALSRRVRLSADGYRRWWASYEEGGLLHGQTPPPELVETAARAGVVFSSIRKRSVETARAVTGGDAFHSDPVFVEAPLPPPACPKFVRLSPRAWGVIARTTWWFLNHHEGQESRRRATARARRAARRLAEAAETGQDVVLVAHGFFNAMIGRELKRLGWKRISTEGYRYWCAQRFERI
jgi:broad specificity phosphatase PhoE